jgi:hypothetical protein
MEGMSPLVARVMALLTMFPATETAAAHADEPGLVEWKDALDCGDGNRTSSACLRHSEHVDTGSRGIRLRLLARLTTEAPVPSCISFRVLLLGLWKITN